MLELPLETHKEYNPWQFILEEKNLIKLANSKYSLADFFDKKSIQFSECYSPSGWNKKTSCIFPDHRDSTPSFHFNETDNIFHEAVKVIEDESLYNSKLKN